MSKIQKLTVRQIAANKAVATRQANKIAAEKAARKADKAAQIEAERIAAEYAAMSAGQKAAHKKSQPITVNGVVTTIQNEAARKAAETKAAAKLANGSDHATVKPVSVKPDMTERLFAALVERMANRLGL